MANAEIKYYMLSLRNNKCQAPEYIGKILIVPNKLQVLRIPIIATMIPGSDKMVIVYDRSVVIPTSTGYEDVLTYDSYREATNDEIVLASSICKCIMDEEKENSSDDKTIISKITRGIDEILEINKKQYQIFVESTETLDTYTQLLLEKSRN